MKRVVHLVALVASFALAAGTAAAMGANSPDDRPTHGPGAVVLEQSSEVVRPDDRATHGQGAIAPEQVSNTARPDDRTIHGPGAITFEQVTRAGQAPVIAPDAQSALSVDGFDWLDAGIGAAAALGLGLIVAGGVALVLRRTHAPAYS
jgi:hypothetical protein